MTSTTEATTTVTEAYLITEYSTGSSYTMSGTNIHMGRNASTRGGLQTNDTRSLHSIFRILPGSWNLKPHRTNKNHRNRLNHNLGLSLYAVIALGCSCFMQRVTRIKLQSLIQLLLVQVQQLTKPYRWLTHSISNRHYGGGVSCQGTTLVIAPFAINGLTAPDSHLRTDFGISMQVSMPLR